MEITAVSIGPIFPNAVHGGAQSVLVDLAVGLSRHGNRVKILCMGRDDNREEFALDRLCSVFPSLPFAPFPIPHDVAPYLLVRILDAIQERAKDADVLYLHGGGLLLSSALARLGKPLVVSLHDFCYPVSMISAWEETAQAFVVPSRYLADCILTCVERFAPSIRKKLIVIPNGVSVHRFPFLPHHAEQEIGISKLSGLIEPGDDPIIACPHRPDPRKGIKSAIKFAATLRDQGMRRVKLLIPRYLDEHLDTHMASSWQDILQAIERAGMADRVAFHQWLDRGELCELYRRATLTLCLGTFVESFGLIPLETMLCGTPAIYTPRGGLREVLVGLPAAIPVWPLDKHSILDAYQTAVNLERRLIEQSAAEIRKRFSVATMVERFEDLFASVSDGVPSPPAIDGATLVRLAPWCLYEKGRIYNDYEGCWKKADALIQAIAREDGLPLHKAEEFAGTASLDLDAAIRKGYLVAVPARYPER